ncbi:MAG: DUF3793 family protein [Anaerococcus sp.]
MYENLLIKYCSPTLANIKTANLFTYFNKNNVEAKELIKSWNKLLIGRGIKSMVLCEKSHSTLIYVYRPKLLYKQINENPANEFLIDLSYDTKSVKKSLDKLKERMLEECFPHEIGIFLGYPYEDVEGFIKNKGKNNLCCGCWKVYKNQTCKEKLFSRYEKVRTSYTTLYSKGKSIESLCINI